MVLRTWHYPNAVEFAVGFSAAVPGISTHIVRMTITECEHHYNYVWQCDCNPSISWDQSEKHLVPCSHIAESFIYCRANEGKKRQLKEEVNNRAEQNRIVKQLRDDLELADEVPGFELKPKRKITLE